MSSDRIANADGRQTLHVDSRREFKLDRSLSRYPRLLSGWAAEQIVLPDGRRQVTGVFLPGERVIVSPLSLGEATSLLAITPLTLSYDPIGPSDAEIDILRNEIDRHLAQSFRAIVRLGCFTAYEKIANVLLEVTERTGAVNGESIDFPLTQELLADLLGLSQVHVNRTLQQLRRDGLIELQGGRLTIRNREQLLACGQYSTLFLRERRA